MNGEIVRNNHSITLLNCKSKSPVHDEMMIKLGQEGRCSLQSDAQRQDEGRRSNPGSLNKMQDSEFTEKRSSYSQCSPCWPDEHASPQIHFSQTYLLSPADGSLAYCKGRSAEPLHTKNCGTRDVRHKRGVRHKAKGNKSTLKGAESKNSQNRKVTDYYPIRRSSRKCKAELKGEQKKHIDDLITNGIEEGLEVQHIEGKGRGVFATRCFQKGEYVVEYHGDLLQITDAKQREAEYAQNPATGCYMYYFQYLSKTFCVDATKETGRMGRLLNHSKSGNCHTKLHDISGIPHLILVASRDIDGGEELLYDYGDRSKASIAAHPWLKY